MIVCLCKGVSDRKIRALAKEGARLSDVVRKCGAGSDCGQCLRSLVQIIKKENDFCASSKLPAAAAG